MRKYFVAAFAFVLLFTPVAARASTQDFTITSFTGDYYLSRDAGQVAELRVSERIVAKFPDFDQNHGILRAIPQDYQGHSLELKIKKVSDERGKSLDYDTYTDNGNLVLRIGDANKYARGENTYVVEYTMRGVSLNLSDHEEFYWDINGDQWEQPFNSVEARVHLSNDVAAQLQNGKACYTGSAGSNSSNCSISEDAEAGGKIVTFKTMPGQTLQARQTLTVVLGFNKDTFAGYTPSAAQLGEWAMMGAGVVAPSLLAAGFMLRSWRRYGRDPKGKGVIVPQYLPPKGVSVLGSNAALKEGFESKAASATIIDLAVRHYIKVYEIKKDSLFGGADYELELVKLPTDLKIEEKGVVDMLFGAGVVGARVKLGDLKTKLASESQELGKKVDVQLATDGYFRVSPEKAKTPYYAGGSALFIVGFILAMAGAVPVAIGLMLAGAVVLVCAQFMPARTLKGVELRDYLLGVRDYMKLAEAERIKVLQSPHGELTEKVDVGDNKQLVKLYERLLPYAMLFGIEKEWSKQMAGLYQQPPDWYAGSTAFNAVWFASSVSSFGASVGATFAAPSSSSSSGFGGSSGGGGGGGGGGGW